MLENLYDLGFKFIPLNMVEQNENWDVKLKWSRWEAVLGACRDINIL